MKTLDVVKHVSLSDIQSRVLRAISPLSFEHPEKALAGRVVAAMADGSHGADQRVPFQEALVIATAKLAAAIRMQDDRSTALALPNGHLYSSNDHLAVLPVMN